MRLDRARQRQVLEALASCYPSYGNDFFAVGEESNEVANLWYLREHELIEASLDQTLGGSFIFSGARITAKGLDFLADDGGLSAILGTVTVKLHADTIRELLIAKIEHSTLPAGRRVG